MNEACYSISEASQKLNVEAHVLRYWEEELNLKVPRNELGHRFYTESLLNTLQMIRDLRQKGSSLKDVRFALDHMTADSLCIHLAEAEAAAGFIDPTTDKLIRFQEIMTDIFSEALARSTDRLGQDISEKVSDQVVKEMDYLMQLQAEKQEAHFRKLDETLRAYQKNQKGRAEAAATKTPVIPLHPHKKFSLFKKRT